MYRKFPFFITLVVVLACPLWVFSAQQPQRVKLEYKFTRGESWSCTDTRQLELWFRLLVDRETTLMDHKMGLSTAIRYETIETKPDGATRLRLHHRLLSADGVEVKKGDKDGTWVVQIDPAGAKAASLGALGFQTNLEFARNAFSLGFNWNDGDFPPLPKEAVGEGDSWEDFVEFKHEGNGITSSTLKLPVRSTVMSLRDGDRPVARIRRAGHVPVNLTFRAPVFEVEAKLRGVVTFTQTVRFDYERGRELGRETQAHAQLEIEAEAPNGSKVKAEFISSIDAKKTEAKSGK